MSRFREINITCQQCGSQQPFTAWESLNADLNPNARDALLAGELMRCTCAQCGTTATVVYPLLYHDRERHLMIWLVVGEGAPATGPIPTSAFMRDYQFRVVTSPNQLVEKIRIFECDLDDRVLEFNKLLLRRGAANAGRILTGELFFNGQGRTASGEEAIQFVLLSPDAPEKLTTLMTQLDRFTRELAGTLPARESEAAQWITVDAAYAAKLAARF